MSSSHTIAIAQTWHRTGARPYEFRRHCFAGAGSRRGADEGVEIHAKWPLLPAYLGHQNLLAQKSISTTHLLELASAASMLSCPNEQEGAEVFVLVGSFFAEYLPRQRGASVHTVRARTGTRSNYCSCLQQNGRAGLWRR